MEKKELILKAVEYVNDIPARVEEFLAKQEPAKKKLPEIEEEFKDFITAWQKYPTHNFHEFFNAYK
jgi:hypothetical protein